MTTDDAAHEDACDGCGPADIVVRAGSDGLFVLQAGDLSVRCAVGRTGLALDKREGDGGTPVGRWPLREVFYRPDNMAKPTTRLPIRALTPEDGWCDAADDPQYNRPVRLPFPASHEEMWRADDVYDVVIVVGYNDDPVVPGKGSAIFMHIARPGFEPTAGCVAVTMAHMMRLLAMIGPETHLVVLAS